MCFADFDEALPEGVDEVMVVFDIVMGMEGWRKGVDGCKRARRDDCARECAWLLLGYVHQARGTALYAMVSWSVCVQMYCHDGVCNDIVSKWMVEGRLIDRLLD